MEDKPGTPEVLTTADVAKILRLSIKTVGDMMRNGELPAMRIGGVWRVRRESLDEWMKRQELNSATKNSPLADSIPLGPGMTKN
jgi:excisionase family DNA binding protein